MKPNKLLLVLLTLSFSAHALTKELDEMGLFFGMSMSSFQEAQSSIQSEDTEQPASGSSSTIATELYYKFYHQPKYSIYSHAFFPLLESGDSSVFSGGMGVEYYFSKVNSRIAEEKDFLSIYIQPKLTYFALAELNLLSISYVTLTSKKVDINGEIAFGGGATYSLGNMLGGSALRASALFGRGVGVVTSTINIRFFAGLVFFI